MKCSKCKQLLTHHFESFMDISVSIFKNKQWMNVPTSLQALIYQSFGECEIEEMSPSLCDKCKTNKYYERFTEILEMPKYLIVHLHRFKEILTTNHRYMRVKDKS